VSMDENEFQTWTKKEAQTIYGFCSSSASMPWETAQQYIADKLMEAYEIGKQNASGMS
jgi:hypothetical protein